MSECKQCEQKPVSKRQIGIIILGFYLLGSAGYGTVKIIENIIHLFK